MEEWHLAIDIGASSGKAVAGRVKDGKIELKQVHRFENGTTRKNGHLIWDLEALKQGVLDSLKACVAEDVVPASVGVDTWGVDFVLLDEESNVLTDAVCYRDERTQEVLKDPEAFGLLSPAELYKRTGIQFQPFNTIYQLCALKKEHPEIVEKADRFLMIPDYLHFVLTGIASNEYTNATTTALVDANTLTWDSELIERIGYRRELFGTLLKPGTVLGSLSEEVQALVGFDCEVVLPTTHDTGSAFLAVPGDKDSVFLSSGTWSLLGVENKQAILSDASFEANMTNEGGAYSTIRYLKNIMGLWMIQSVRKEEEKERGYSVSFPELIEEARSASSYMGLVDVGSDRFLAPYSMKNEVRKAVVENGYEAPKNTGEILICIYNSLARKYAEAVDELSLLTGHTYTSLHIVGGGCQDMLLNEKTAEATGLKVFAGPTEGTALGNLIVQFIHGGEFSNVAEARKCILASMEIKEV